MYYASSYPAEPALEGASPPRAAALRLTGTYRVYGSVVALAPLTLALEQGAVCVVRGPNGAGKTTLLRLAAGLLRPSGGERVARAPALYLAAGDGGRAVQRVDRAVAFAARLAGGDAGGVLEACGLEAFRDCPVATLSDGERTRLTLAVALAARPALLCLDEPTAHLDDAGVEIARAAVRRLVVSGTAVLLATHEPAAFAGVADATVSLRAGNLEVVR
jgi:ABC-type multidrug transport system ATPase subunit